MYGHCNPEITSRVKQQLDQLDQVVFSGFTHPPAIELSEKLVEILPGGINKIFFSDNGSTSVDVAIKMALQYHFNRGEKRNKIIAFENAFHGRTMGAQLVGGNPKLKKWIGTPDPTFVQVPFPDGYSVTDISFDLFRKTLADKGIKETDIAGVLTESYQGGGADFLSQNPLKQKFNIAVNGK